MWQDPCPVPRLIPILDPRVPLFDAVKRGDLAGVEHLLRENPSEGTISFALTIAARHGHLQILEALLALPGLRRKIAGARQNAALREAVAHQQWAIVERLARAPGVFASDDYFLRIIGSAASAGRLELVEYLFSSPIRPFWLEWSTVLGSGNWQELAAAFGYLMGVESLRRGLEERVAMLIETKNEKIARRLLALALGSPSPITPLLPHLVPLWLALHLQPSMFFQNRYLKTLVLDQEQVARNFLELLQAPGVADSLDPDSFIVVLERMLHSQVLDEYMAWLSSLPQYGVIEEYVQHAPSLVEQAAKRGRTDIVARWLEAAATPQSQHKRATIAFSRGLEHCHPQLLDYLLAHHLSFNSQPPIPPTALLVATQKGEVPVIDLLLQNLSRQELKQQTEIVEALVCAVKSARVDVVQRLLQHPLLENTRENYWTLSHVLGAVCRVHDSRMLELVLSVIHACKLARAIQSLWYIALSVPSFPTLAYLLQHPLLELQQATAYFKSFLQTKDLSWDFREIYQFPQIESLLWSHCRDPSLFYVVKYLAHLAQPPPAPILAQLILCPPNHLHVLLASWRVSIRSLVLGCVFYAQRYWFWEILLNCELFGAALNSMAPIISSYVNGGVCNWHKEIRLRGYVEELRRCNDRRQCKQLLNSISRILPEIFPSIELDSESLRLVFADILPDCESKKKHMS